MAIVTVTTELLAKALADTNWEALDAQTDEEMERNVASDPDSAPILTSGETAAAIARTVRKRLGLSQSEFAARFEGRRSIQSFSFAAVWAMRLP